MSDNIKLCRSCMGTVPAGVNSCPSCGYDGHQQNSPESLPIGFRLAGRYVVGMRRGGDADCAVYVGYDCTLNRQIEIREYLPEGNCTRNSATMELVPHAGSELFYKTALMDFSDLYKNLHRIEGVPGIIRTSDFFETNATAYAVLDSFDGVTLREFLSMAGGMVSCEQALKLLEPVFEAVEAIHKVNLIHRGISPDTIFLNRNGDVRLGGFATSQIRTKGTEVPGCLYSGYAAPEQYSTTAWQDMSTDVYALAAVFYRCVSGITPRDAEQRRSHDTLAPLSEAKAGVDTALSGIIAAAMVLDPQVRTQEARKLLESLKKPASWLPSRMAQVKLPEKTGEDLPTTAAAKRNRQYPAWIERFGVKNFWTMVVTTAVIVVLATVTLLFGNALFGGGKSEPDPDPDNGMVKVQNFIGCTEAEARALAEADADLVYKFADIYRDGEDGIVVEQSPKADTEVAKGVTVTLYVNRKIATVTVPNVVGYPLEAAIERLNEYNLRYMIVEQVDNSQPEGYVIGQDPPKDTPVTPEARVTIIVCIHSEDSSDPSNSEPERTLWIGRRDERWRAC